MVESWLDLDEKPETGWNIRVPIGWVELISRAEQPGSIIFAGWDSSRSIWNALNRNLRFAPSEKEQSNTKRIIYTVGEGPPSWTSWVHPNHFWTSPVGTPRTLQSPHPSWEHFARWFLHRTDTPGTTSCTQGTLMTGYCHSDLFQTFGQPEIRLPDSKNFWGLPRGKPWKEKSCWIVGEKSIFG